MTTYPNRTECLKPKAVNGHKNISLGSVCNALGCNHSLDIGCPLPPGSCYMSDLMSCTLRVYSSGFPCNKKRESWNQGSTYKVGWTV